VGWDPDKEDNSGRTPQYRVTAGRGAGTRAAASEPPPASTSSASNYGGRQAGNLRHVGRVGIAA
jgi:hypothetical protein